MFRMRKGEELKTSRYASAAASRNDRLPYSQQFNFSNVIIKDRRLLIKSVRLLEGLKQALLL